MGHWRVDCKCWFEQRCWALATLHDTDTNEGSTLRKRSSSISRRRPEESEDQACDSELGLLLLLNCFHSTMQIPCFRLCAGRALGEAQDNSHHSRTDRCFSSRTHQDTHTLYDGNDNRRGLCVTLSCVHRAPMASTKTSPVNPQVATRNAMAKRLRRKWSFGLVKTNETRQVDILPIGQHRQRRCIVVNGRNLATSHTSDARPAGRDTGGSVVSLFEAPGPLAECRVVLVQRKI
jgi:hypothetical protein